MGWRTTVCNHKIDEKWNVTQEHNTVPFEVALELACRFARSTGLPLPELAAWEET